MEYRLRGTLRRTTMDFPKERMEIVSHHGGKESEGGDGWC